jgi:branched-subunit amino acid aminotransferase/4-amino-4-deoxychorismate lyase
MDNRKNYELYGSGIFSTIAVRDGMPIHWEKHWKRVLANAETIGIDLHHFRSDDVLSRLTKAIEDHGLIDGKARLTVFDNRSSEIWPSDDATDSPPAVLDILVGKSRPLPKELSVTLSSYAVNARSPLAGVKSCNYLEPILSLEEAKKRGSHEAVRLNERGHITSACMANVFWEKGGEMFTPALSTGCLAGTTREYVLENIDCREVEAPIEELEQADAIFLTSAGVGIARVANYEGRRLKDSRHTVEELWPPV